MDRTQTQISECPIANGSIIARLFDGFYVMGLEGAHYIFNEAMPGPVCSMVLAPQDETITLEEAAFMLPAKSRLDESGILVCEAGLVQRGVDKYLDMGYFRSSLASIFGDGWAIVLGDVNQIAQASQMKVAYFFPDVNMYSPTDDSETIMVKNKTTGAVERKEVPRTFAATLREIYQDDTATAAEISG